MAGEPESRDLPIGSDGGLLDQVVIPWMLRTRVARNAKCCKVWGQGWGMWGVLGYVGVCWVGGWRVWGLVRKKSEVSLEHAAKREPAISSQHWSYTTCHLRSNELFSRCPATWLLPTAWWHGDGARGSTANCKLAMCLPDYFGEGLKVQLDTTRHSTCVGYPKSSGSLAPVTVFGSSSSNGFGI